MNTLSSFSNYLTYGQFCFIFTPVPFLTQDYFEDNPRYHITSLLLYILIFSKYVQKIFLNHEDHMTSPLLKSIDLVAFA